jgi:hypothetical protein
MAAIPYTTTASIIFPLCICMASSCHHANAASVSQMQINGVHIYSPDNAPQQSNGLSLATHTRSINFLQAGLVLTPKSPTELKSPYLKPNSCLKGYMVFSLVGRSPCRCPFSLPSVAHERCSS